VRRRRREIHAVPRRVDHDAARREQIGTDHGQPIRETELREDRQVADEHARRDERNAADAECDVTERGESPRVAIGADRLGDHARGVVASARCAGRPAIGSRSSSVEASTISRGLSRKKDCVAPVDPNETVAVFVDPATVPTTMTPTDADGVYQISLGVGTYRPCTALDIGAICTTFDLTVEAPRLRRDWIETDGWGPCDGRGC
jgi:hypothetical protein